MHVSSLQISRAAAALERVASQEAYATAGRNSVAEAGALSLDPALGGKHMIWCQGSTATATAGVWQCSTIGGKSSCCSTVRIARLRRCFHENAEGTGCRAGITGCCCSGRADCRLSFFIPSRNKTALCIAEFTISRPSVVQRAKTAAAVHVKKALGLQPAPQARGPGHYLIAVAAPLGALAVFAALAVALSQKVLPNGPVACPLSMKVVGYGNDRRHVHCLCNGMRPLGAESRSDSCSMGWYQGVMLDRRLAPGRPMARPASQRCQRGTTTAAAVAATG